MSSLGKHWKLSKVTRQKQSIAAKKRANTKEAIERIRKVGFNNRGRKASLELRQKLGEIHKKINSAQYFPDRIGQKHSEETKRKIGYAQMGEKNHNWQGGKTKDYQLFRTSAIYKQWRRLVYERDHFTCVLCGTKGNGRNLNADHIKPFAYFPELRLDVNNGRTLCIPCHKLTDTYLSKAKIYEKTA